MKKLLILSVLIILCNCDNNVNEEFMAEKNYHFMQMSKKNYKFIQKKHDTGEIYGLCIVDENTLEINCLSRTQYKNCKINYKIAKFTFEEMRRCENNEEEK